MFSFFHFMFFFRLISRLPLWVLYLFSDLLYLIARYVIRYRKKVIDENLTHAFPDKSPKEIKDIRNKFYRNFTDAFIAETIKLLTISEEEFRRRFVIVNQQDLDQPVNNGVSSLMMAGHIFNWEWGVVGSNLYSKVPVETVYLKVNNPFFNNLMKTIRTRFGGYVTEKKEFRRGMLTLGRDPRIVLLGSDQRPPSSENRYQREFLNRPAVFFEGAEFLSKKKNLVVHYGKMIKIKRGHYRYEYVPLASPPYDSDKPHSITDRFCEMLEENIKEQPDMYLWSHKRWKL
ncbi:lysophospholipid acyltransferase family protein [Algoriphagus sediminis]|uniref:Lysophospholipid acyltransferase family protein n=1 Tax=Algoriphagus sediminis TaxID=3057113 RepID=A0ABT7YFR3_9BACT|nr:lysophospholipid acyltransferase family protein [Algoriphagus sediminis]MDN3205366.1 lysophospholipid acyltransferase family protein [Algoriphagus sediminis]